MNPEHLLQHFDRLSEAPDAIARLRRFILDLAVRGKLVEQDTNDEPGSELLKRNLVWRAEAIKNKQIREPRKTLKDISHVETLYALPAGWAFARLGEIIYIQSGDGLIASNMKNGDVPVFGGNGINGYHDESNVEKPTIVIGRVGYYCGSIHVTPYKAWVTDNAFITRFCQQAISMDFLVLLLNGTNLKENENATAQPVISGSKLYPIVIGLPPLAEQHRIVAKVDELMALCDQFQAAQTEREQCRDRLVAASLHQLQNANGFTPRHQDAKKDEKAEQENLGTLAPWREPMFLQNLPRLTTRPAHIKQLRQTILNLAVRGKLVPQDPNDEPAAELLKRIKAEKSQLLKEGKIKKLEMPSEVDEDETPFELPNNWCWSRLDNVLSKLTDGTHHSPPNDQNGEFKYVTAKNIKPEGVSLANITNVSAEIHWEIYARCNPEKGDILYIKDGATTGVVTINNLDEPFSMLSSVALLKLPGCLFNRLIVEFLRSPFFYDQMRGFMKGAAITRVTLKRMAPALIPLPPIAEQYRIVAKVDELMTLCDQLETQLNTTQADSRRLLEAVLHEALASTPKEAV
ncbi:MAG: hypothetical protein HOP23_14280 [Methylococcaceae bacterium]|nr:hypothetical protein [Methylococcaceae bacterium]